MDIDLIAAGKRIHAIRMQHNYSMAAFAKLVGNSSASTVNNWEKGNNLPNPERLKKLSLLGNTTIDWIRYGDLEEYVDRLLSKTNLKKPLTSQQMKQLLTALNKRKITYLQDLTILTTASELFPELFESSYLPSHFTQKNELIAEDFTTYKIEKNDQYRNNILPLMEELLYDSKNKHVNASLLFQTFDLLKRTPNEKQLLQQVFAIIAEITTDDISYKSTSSSKIVNYDAIAKKANSKQGKPLSNKTIEKKYSKAKEELLYLLDKYYLANHPE